MKKNSISKSTFQKGVTIKKISLALGALFFLSLLIAGCAGSGPLDVKYAVKQDAQQGAKLPFVVLVKDFADSRPQAPGASPRTIGKIDSTVTDMTATRLVLAEDVSTLVTNAYVQELAAAGFSVKTEKDADIHDVEYIMTGEVKQFSLDILSRDKIEIEIATALTENGTGKKVWSGVESEKADRFAGVTGNSRASISRYLSASLSKVVKKSINEASVKIARSKGVSTRPVAAPLVAVPFPSEVNAAPAAAAPAESTGRLTITSEPARAKVYIKDVYYGLTPFTLDIEAGIYEITVKQKGYAESREKVSVRAGQVTEMEMSLDKQ